MDKIDEVLRPLEQLAEQRLSRAGAPHSMPANGESVGELRRWAIQREYHDRVAAGVAMACAFLRQHVKNMRAEDGDWTLKANSAGLLAEMARIAEWGVVLRLLESSDKASISVERVEDLFPDVLRGRKIINSARAAHEATHGTEEQKRHRWAEYQRAIELKLSKSPRKSLTQARQEVAKAFGVSLRTIERNTKNPRKK